MLYLTSSRQGFVAYWKNQAHTQERLEVERAKYQASGGIPTDNLELKIGDIVETQFGKAKITKVNKKTVSVDFEEAHLGHFHNLDKTSILGKLPQ